MNELTDEQIIEFVAALGLVRRANDTVIDQMTGLYHDSQRYVDHGRALIAADRAHQSARHAEELAAYELTINNLHRDLMHASVAAIAEAHEVDRLNDLREMVDPMTEVADRYAHRLALELECVLADRPGYYDRALTLIGEYRAAMNAIHERESPTFMGEPLPPKDAP